MELGIDWKKREPRGLYEPIDYTMAAGGKRLRPTLAILACQLMGGQENDVRPAALALEVFHNFTLLHDDLMDHAATRRGQATVHVKWNENTAILSGDQMLIEAYRLLAQVKEDKLPQVLKWFNEMATEICEGQQYDMDYEQRMVSIADYMKMIRLKTAVLLANALRIGGYMAGAQTIELSHLYDYGIGLGLAFQLQDDYLDCYGDEATFGKPIGGDIREGKKTWMYIQAWQLGTEEDRQILESKDYTRVMAVYEKLGVGILACREIERLTEEAMEHVRFLPQNPYANQLLELANQLIKRNK